MGKQGKERDLSDSSSLLARKEEILAELASVEKALVEEGWDSEDFARHGDSASSLLEKAAVLAVMDVPLSALELGHRLDLEPDSKTIQRSDLLKKELPNLKGTFDDALLENHPNLALLKSRRPIRVMSRGDDHYTVLNGNGRVQALKLAVAEQSLVHVRVQVVSNKEEEGGTTRL